MLEEAEQAKNMHCQRVTDDGRLDRFIICPFVF